NHLTAKDAEIRREIKGFNFNTVKLRFFRHSVIFLDGISQYFISYLEIMKKFERFLLKACRNDEALIILWLRLILIHSH
ncbi:MAG: hypothetical protein KAI17_11500, partial [Thiotrichaceae bacterium]|nr:hypothetical protein [Thiotrichaceae bacterium]